MLFIFFTQFVRVYGFAVFYNDVNRCDLREMSLEHFCRVVHGNGNDGAVCFSSDPEAAFVERKHIQFIRIGISGTFRENTDGNAGFYFFDGFQDGFKPLFNILSVKKQTVEIFHPVGKQRIPFHFFFGYIAGPDGAAAVGKQDVKVASVISDIEYRCVFGDVFFPDDGYFHTCDPQNKFKDCLNDSEGTDILFHWGDFSDDPFDDENGD